MATQGHKLLFRQLGTFALPGARAGASPPPGGGGASRGHEEPPGGGGGDRQAHRGAGGELELYAQLIPYRTVPKVL
jgi:hypothetical protein